MNQSIEALESTTFANKRFTRKQLSIIQDTVDEFPNLSLRELGHTICENIQWLTPAGNHKIQACLTALEQMEAIGLFALPTKRSKKKATLQDTPWTEKTKEAPNIHCQLEELGPIKIQRVVQEQDIKLWNEYVDRYHYLKYKRPIGTYSRYFVVSGEGKSTILGCLLFSATAVYSSASRDQWINWKEKNRKKNLNLIINNGRFLIFPWVNVPNLASKSLSIISKQLPDDWEKDHGYRPVLLETFVDPTKFKGTCYKAANWLHVGKTSGHQWNKELPDKENSRKDIYLYPLVDNFRSILTSNKSLKNRNKPRQELQQKEGEIATNDPFIKLWQKIMGIVSVQAREYDQKWQKRKRLIDTMLIILFVFRLVFSKNNQGYQITIIELWDQCRRMNYPLPQKKPVAPSAMCNARKKLDENIFKEINTKVINTYEKAESQSDYQWKKHRVFGVDGSKLNLPRQLKKQGYNTPSKNANYPQGLLSCLYQLKSQIPYDFDLVSHNNERTAALHHLQILKYNDVVVYDRGYYSYAVLYYHNQLKIHSVFRMKKKSYKAVDDFMLSDETDQTITIMPSKSNQKEIRTKYPDIEFIPIKLRLVKYTHSGTTYTLGTTLLDPEEYTITELSDLYHDRWGIEELYKVSKVLIDVEEFHSQSERGVKQELFAHFVLITMNRIFVNKAEDGFQKTDTPSNVKTTEQKSGKFKANLKNALITIARNLEGLFVQHTTLVTAVVNKIIVRVSSCKQKERLNRKYERKSMKPTNKWRSTTKKKTPAQ